MSIKKMRHVWRYVIHEDPTEWPFADDVYLWFIIYGFDSFYLCFDRIDFYGEVAYLCVCHFL